MASSASHGGGAAAAKQLRVLLTFSGDDRLRIPDELAEEIGAGEALVVGPCGVKSRAVWPVGLGRDGGGAFLGRGWPELAAAHGVGAGWRLAPRHRGRGVLTIKAFDESCCIRDLGAKQPAAASHGLKEIIPFSGSSFPSIYLGDVLRFSES
ncbi:putative B3 domain-containing protein [Panicum miliaceum]|uniref:B3 domain-containing protein n=1 Tax=Panicum miliaceum TaxID=4540 RepID=A0A3L6Q848_PANMI|nr:putative B3 domain-containing protein [Panicum miliaceum]